MSNKERYLLKAVGDDHAATKAGVIKFLELCQKYGDGVIYVPTKQHVDSTILASAIGEDLVKSLAKNKPFSLPTGQKIELCSDRTFKNHKSANVYLVLWATPQMISAMENGSYTWQASVVVTWLENDADEWASEHAPVELSW